MMEIHPQFEASNHGQYAWVHHGRLRTSPTSWKINQRMEEFREYKIFGDSVQLTVEAIIRVAYHTDQTQVSALK